MSAETKPPDKLMAQVAEAANHGRYIWLARLGWLIIFVLMMSLFAVNLPHVYLDTANEWQVGQALLAALQIFPSIKEFAIALIGLRLVALTIFVGTALFLAWRKWDDWFVLFVSATLLMMAYMFGMNFDVDLIRYPRWLELIFPAIRSVVPVLLIMGMLLLFYLFPDGRFVPRWLGLLLLPALIVLVDVFGVTFEAPWDDFTGRILGDDVDWWTLFTSLLLASALVGLISQFVRYRFASSQEQRQQTKWVLLGLASIIVTPFLLSVILDQLALGSQSTRHFISIIIETIIPILLPVTIAVSIMRYKLWEVDLFINRALVYGVLTALVVILYVVVVGILGTLFQSGNNLFLSVLATGLIAALFNPLRQRLQRNVNRFMYGQRDDPMTVMTELGKQLENTAVPGETLPALVQTIAQTLKLPYVAIVTNDDGVIASVGAVREPPLHNYPLVYQSQTIGRLAVSQRTVKKRFTEDEERLLRSVSRQAGTAVYAYQLTDQLQRSRERLVTTREEERRRLRRDLHDGLGPQLATLTVKVSAARNLLDSDLEAVENLLAEVKAESQNAIKEIRRVVDGLRPSALDQLGLASALQEFVAQTGNGRTQITLYAPEDMPTLPAAVEVAAYRIAIEAVTNSIRHANAQTCSLRLALNDYLRLEIDDDGDGLPNPVQPGVGLSSMRERAVELGGAFEIKSQLGSGTQIVTTLPITVS